MIKICGLTSLADAQLAAAAGADAVGFVFAASPRQARSERIAAIVRELPAAVMKVGVFVNAGAEEMLATARQAGLTVLQLAGDEPPATARRLAPYTIWKTVHMREPDYDPMARQWTPAAEALVLDASGGGCHGGAGQPFDWRRAAALAAAPGASSRLVVAGGLTPENVAACIAQVRPWGVDVSSGIEAAPGRKDPARLRDFIAAAKTAFAQFPCAPFHGSADRAPGGPQAKNPAENQ